MKNTQTTRAYYNGISKGYQELYHEEQIQKISKVKQFLPKEGSLLDLGAGDGVLNQFLSKDINLTSFDLSDELLKLNPNTNTIQGDAQNLPFNNQEFDFISSFTVFQDIPDPIKALLEAKRVLKDDGTFILSFLHVTKKGQEIITDIKKEFTIIEEIKEEKDSIFVLKKKY